MAEVIFNGRVQLTDEHGLTSSKIVAIAVDDAVYTTPTTRFTAAVARLQDFVSALDAIVDPLITDVSLNVPAAPAGLKSVFGDQGVAEGANLEMSTVDAEGVHSRPYWLPGAKAGVFLPNFKTIDTADGDLLDWVATFFDASDVRITISDGETVQAINSGYYATRRRSSNA